jgi:phosphate starvation-inducible PhoH-like protein
MHILNGIKGISIIQMDNNDVIRHKLVTKIIRAYERNSDIPLNEPPQLQD